MRVLFVCLGNICRSPTAEGVFEKLLADAGRTDIDVDSAGTGAWHVGNPADARMRKAASERGYRLTSRARQVEVSDFSRFDHVIAMDRDNLLDLEQLCPPEHQSKLRLLRDLDDPGADPDVPDPYYGGPRGFVEVVDIVERCCRRLLEELS